MSCSSASPAERGRPVSSAGPATGKLPRQGPDTVHTILLDPVIRSPSQTPWHHQEQRHGGASRRCPELQSHLVSQSAPRRLRSERPSPSSCPSTRDHGGCRRPGGGSAHEASALRQAPDRRWGWTARTRTSLPLTVKIKTQKNCTRRSKKEKEQQRCRRRGGQQKASVRTWASRTPNRAQSCSQGVARGGGGRFLVLLRMVYGRGRESQEERRRNSPV